MSSPNIFRNCPMTSSTASSSVMASTSVMAKGLGSGEERQGVNTLVTSITSMN